MRCEWRVTATGTRSVSAPGEKNHQRAAVVLDFVNPVGSSRRLNGAGSALKEAVEAQGKDPVLKHGPSVVAYLQMVTRNGGPIRKLICSPSAVA